MLGTWAKKGQGSLLSAINELIMLLQCSAEAVVGRRDWLLYSLLYAAIYVVTNMWNFNFQFTSLGAFFFQLIQNQTNKSKQGNKNEQTNEQSSKKYNQKRKQRVEKINQQTRWREPPLPNTYTEDDNDEPSNLKMTISILPISYLVLNALNIILHTLMVYSLLSLYAHSKHKVQRIYLINMSCCHTIVNLVELCRTVPHFINLSPYSRYSLG